MYAPNALTAEGACGHTFMQAQRSNRLEHFFFLQWPVCRSWEREKMTGFVSGIFRLKFRFPDQCPAQSSCLSVKVSESRRPTHTDSHTARWRQPFRLSVRTGGVCGPVLHGADLVVSDNDDHNDDDNTITMNNTHWWQWIHSEMNLFSRKCQRLLV